MDNKDSGSSLAIWLSGGAVIFSLVVSTFALTRTPFFEFRPADDRFQAQLPIRARLWQDPFDAMERYREKLKDGDSVCMDMLVDNSQSLDVTGVNKTINTSTALPTESRLDPSDELPSAMVALVEGGSDSDEVELRRRTRYAILTGFKTARMVPHDQQSIRCLTLADDMTSASIRTDISSKERLNPIEIPYEIFDANPFDPPTDINEKRRPGARTILFWVTEGRLGLYPLQKLENLRRTLACKIAEAYGSTQTCSKQSESAVLKVIGPSTVNTLRAIYRQDAEGIEVPHIEIYSPLVSTSRRMLMRSFNEIRPGETGSQQTKPTTRTGETQIKLVRTVSNDELIASRLLDELKLRHIDPASAIQCSRRLQPLANNNCRNTQYGQNRIALISEWDSFYGRALVESFKLDVVANSHSNQQEFDSTEDWILNFSYFRDLDGRLPTENSKSYKTTENNTKDSNKLDINPLERPYGNSQLDYLYRLANLIASQDEAYRREGESGIGAIGVFGSDIYDKLLVMQILKSRMPYKVFFSTNLDSQILQPGQLEAARNLILAANYGLTLPLALQQYVPPFRDSLQTAIYISILAAQSPQSFRNKLEKFDYSRSSMLSPRIYEVGISGFIPLDARANQSDPRRCEAPHYEGLPPHDIMAWRCLQEPPPPLYPEASDFERMRIASGLAYFSAGPLSLILLVLAVFIGWWWVNIQPIDNTPLRWRHKIVLVLYVLSAIFVVAAVHYWLIELMWGALVLILIGLVCSQLILRVSHQSPLENSHASHTKVLSSSTMWFITGVPNLVFILALLWAYQNRSSLTENGLGEPIYLFEGISAWPALALRLLAICISLSAVALGWRCIQIHDREIRTTYHLPVCRPGFWRYFPRIGRGPDRLKIRDYMAELARYLFRVLLPLSTTSITWAMVKAPIEDHDNYDCQRHPISAESIWREYCICGTFGARQFRAILSTWLLFVITSPLYAIWPISVGAMRGLTPSALPWQITIGSLIAFQMLVFWIIDANRLRTRFIRHLSSSRILWPSSLQNEHERTFGVRQHICIDEWVSIKLIAQRSIAVNRLIYAPTAVLLLLVLSCNKALLDWPTPPSMFVALFLTTLLLFASALSLRRAAEKARETVLQHIDDYLLEVPSDVLVNDKFLKIRERIATLNTGAFSRYSEEPLVRALLLSLTGIGGSAIIDTLNYFKH